MQSPLRELEIERELSHELRDDLLFWCTPIFIKFDYRKCNFATIRGYARFFAILRGAQVRGGSGARSPPEWVSRKAGLARGHFKGEKKKKETKNPARQPSPQRPPCAQE